MEKTIKRDAYDIIFSEENDVVIMFDQVKDMEFVNNATINMTTTVEEGFIVKIIKDDKNTLTLEEFPLEAGVVIEDLEDIVIAELNEEGDIAQNYLAKVII
jgi:hypothetical protein